MGLITVATPSSPPPTPLSHILRDIRPGEDWQGRGHGRDWWQRPQPVLGGSWPEPQLAHVSGDCRHLWPVLCLTTHPPGQDPTRSPGRRSLPVRPWPRHGLPYVELKVAPGPHRLQVPARSRFSGLATRRPQCGDTRSSLRLLTSHAEKPASSEATQVQRDTQLQAPASSAQTHALRGPARGQGLAGRGRVFPALPCARPVCRVLCSGLNHHLLSH